MTTISIIGGTGYAGSNIAREALRRGHTVTAWARSAPAEPIDGVRYRIGSVLDADTVREAAADDVLVLATHAQLADEHTLGEALGQVVQATVDNKARLGVVGGAGSSLVAAGGPRLVDTPEFPTEYKPEALAHAEVLEALRASESDVDWFYVSPAATFGAWVPGEDRGTYRTGGDVLVVDEQGDSSISGVDFARAFVDEIEQGNHPRQRFTVGN
ncbi:NAD(P)-dependent oxidoreductase [Nocardioides sp. Bht2]|uniref:NAD(P)-dependent oxidoreductase n=1 Tax=Nocardioides sp. Bht2 TaxID=3392297 RepID=UPI0039B54FBD